jgi:tetratricopeptide (TPR) repeat protein
MVKEDASVQYFESKLSQFPNSLVFSRLADGYRKNGEIQQAIGVCMQGLKSHPDYVTGRVILGRCYLEQEKHKEAIAEFIKVIELDRRNQMAAKMIADIYCRQGMKEKAGDLYAFLLSMDPDNPTLIKLTATFKGTGDTNIQRVLGIAAPASGMGGAVTENMPAETVDETARTIEMDFSTRPPSTPLRETADLNDMLVKTQEFNVNELGSAASGMGEEIVADDAEKEDGAVTGDDISSRMSIMFGDDTAPRAAATEPEILDHIEIGPENVPDLSGVTFDTGAVRDSGIVSGTDISSRIEQLFGIDEEASSPAVEADYTQMYDINETIKPLPEVSLFSAPTKEYRPDELRSEEKADLSGEDVESRLNEMFDEPSKIDLLDENAIAGDRLSAVTPVQEKDDGRETDVQTSETAEGLIDITEEVDSGAETITQEISAGQGDISGDDVALRLDTIFNAGMEAEEPGEVAVVGAQHDEMDVLQSGGIPVQEEDLMDLEEDTKPPIDIGDSSIVVGGDEVPGDESDTIIDTNLSVPLADTDAPEEQTASRAVATDDLPHPDEEGPAPVMSGEDVVGRLNELFNDNLMMEGDLKSAEQIPDGDKEGDKEGDDLNQGFYTMSGGNAQTAESGDILLSDLDKTDPPARESDMLDLVRKPGEKTVLVDEDAANDAVFSEGETGPKAPSLPPYSVTERRHGEDANGMARFNLPPPASEDSSGEENDARLDHGLTQSYVIPDHVLTPTLADIYYQQGQPQLALQIYRRLLEADPDNERISLRMGEIEASLESQETSETVIIDKKSGVFATPVLSPEEEKKQRNSVEPKPLAGIKIKKKFKNKIKKTK